MPTPQNSQGEGSQEEVPAQTAPLISAMRERMEKEMQAHLRQQREQFELHLQQQQKDQQEQFQQQLRQQQQQHNLQLEQLKQQLQQQTSVQPPATSTQQPAQPPQSVASVNGQPPQRIGATALTDGEPPILSGPGFRPHVTLKRFNGKQSAVTWWCQFLAFIQLQRLTARDAITSLHFYLEGAAETWFASLDPIIKTSLEAIREAFMARFRPSSKLNLKLLECSQKEDETVEDYFHRITSSLADRPIDQDWLVHELMKGLKSEIKKPVIQEDPQTLEELRNTATRAEVAERFSGGATVSKGPAADNSKLDVIMDKIASLDASVNAFQREKPTSAKCGNCGRFCQSPSECFARNKKCKYCKSLHHFWRLCRKRQTDIKNGKSGKLPTENNVA